MPNRSSGYVSLRVWVGESLNSLVVFVSDEVARYLLSDVCCDIAVDPVRSEDIVGEIILRCDFWIR